MSQKVELTIVAYKTEKGNIRIQIDGGSYLLKDEPCNWGLIAAIEVEINYVINSQTTTK